MEQKHHKIETIKKIVLDHFNFVESTIDFNGRKSPAPFLKKVIAYLCQKHTEIVQQEIANYFNFSTHSSISIAISSLIKNGENDEKLQLKLKDLDRILIDKGLSKMSGKNKDWYFFLDLNNFIIATKGIASVLWHNTNIVEIKKILGAGWEFTEHHKTDKFLYKRIKQIK